MLIKRIIDSILFRKAKPCIIFESYPDFSDNSRPVFNELVRLGYGKKYMLIWIVSYNSYAILKNGKPYYWRRGDYSKLEHRMYNYSIDKGIKAVVLCNRLVFLPFISKFGKSFYLTHGTPLKDTSGYYTLPDEIDYCIASSQQAKELIARSFNFNSNKIFVLGYPRNDELTRSQRKSLPIDGVFKKTIIWYPTFKQHKNGIKTGSKTALPLLSESFAAQKINAFLTNNNCLLIIKPHFVQDSRYIVDQGLSNIFFIDDQFYTRNNITAYQFIAQCDALLTDYSSVYCDYLLCDKPIGLIWEDIEEYRINPGLCREFEELCSGATKIYNVNDMLEFIQNVIDEKDLFKEERHKARDLLNISEDGNNTNRVVNFIIKEAGL